MTKSLIRPLVLATLAGTALVTMAEAQPKSRFAGRVAGLAVSVLDQTPSGSGKEVDFQVDMTTVRGIRRGAERGGFVFSAFSPSEINSSLQGLGGLGDGDIRLVQTASDTAGRPFTAFITSNNDPRGALNFYAGSALYALSSFRSAIEGELPALSFGDGATVDATSLSPYGTPTTTTPDTIPLVRSRWRGIFTHTYPDGNAYTVRAASRCCPVRAQLGDDDTQERGGLLSTLFTGNRVYPLYSSEQDVTWADREVVRARNVSLTGTFRQVPSTVTLTDGSTYTGVAATLPLFYPLGQVTNTVGVEQGFGVGVLQIPTASTVGLSVLSLLLAGLGFIALRTGR